MDRRNGTTSKAKARGGPSLVEKAAAKLGAASLHQNFPPVETVLSAVEAAGQPNEPLNSGQIAPQPASIQSAKLEPVPAPAPAAAQSVQAQNLKHPEDPQHSSRELRARSTSRQVMIDFDRLRVEGILTPDRGRSLTTEQFRIIKNSVLRNRWQENTNLHNLIMVTSAVPGEGKTFTAINLAMSIASERDLTVLLIDGDLSRPSIVKRLGIKADKGLLDLLEDPTLDVGDVILRTNVESLSVIPAGKPNQMSTELLASTRMKRLVEEISKRYPDRIIVFDAPPVLATTESSILARHADQIVFVVEAEGTRRSAVKSALDLISSCPNIGLVLNKARPQFGATQFGSYYGGYYGYGDSENP
jgi:receptor protein-tyrosine kinase